MTAQYFTDYTEGTVFYKQDRRHGILQTKMKAQYSKNNADGKVFLIQD